MKYYGIQYHRIDNKLKFYAFTHWALSERIEINESAYFSLFSQFKTIKRNSYLTGVRTK